MKYDAIILAGGQASRLGGLDKARLDLAGSPLIARPLQACRGAERVVVVGSPPDSVCGLEVTREDPPGGGPAAATVAGAKVLAAGNYAAWMLLLSCDLPMAVAGVQRLIAYAEANVSDADGYCLTDKDGRVQWLFALYRGEALQRAVLEHPNPSGTSMRRLLSGLSLQPVPNTADLAGDLDTWDDHAAWTARLENGDE